VALPHLVLFDDAIARGWAPFSLTRPAGELLHGAYTLRERTEQALGLRCVGHLSADHLIGVHEHGAAPVLDRSGLQPAAPTVVISSRCVLEAGAAPPDWGTTPGVLAIDDQPCGWYLPAGSPPPSVAELLEPGVSGAERRIPLAGSVLTEVWDLIALGTARTGADVEAAGAAGSAGIRAEILGDAPLRVGRNVIVEPAVVLDLRNGPIWLDDDVTVRAFTRLEGPSYVGRACTLLGGPFTAVSLGPHCKVHGEMEETVVLGYTNKAHDGFLGHAYLGRWVNLGAMTTNSDLKNNYGSVRLWTPGGERDTGLMKLGCLLGDHVKTGIGTLLNTGTVVGAGSNLFGAAMPPKHVPAFSWGSGVDLGAYDVDRFLAVTEKVMARRGITLPEGERAMLARAWTLGRSDA
jgi:UDP-N-acetylglucosamine diphosphorylase / glucose-1-phosphate thymidylyltransferase / UDP-N-acetylgalactosamine diphosphorylase / glucosamine-1-phosphate N-acetyltransferase / galactosamine-1-phosphate N-acetyltransferase